MRNIEPLIGFMGRLRQMPLAGARSGKKVSAKRLVKNCQAQADSPLWAQFGLGRKTKTEQ